MLAFLAAIAGAWYLLIVRPQKAMGDRHASVVGAMVVGDCVLTVGGIFGRVAAIEGDSVLLELAPGTTSRIATAGIARIVPAGDAPAIVEAPAVAATAPTTTIPHDAQVPAMHDHQHHQAPQHPFQQPQPAYAPPHVQQPVAQQQPQYAPPVQQHQAPQPAYAPPQVAHYAQPPMGSSPDGQAYTFRATPAAPPQQEMHQFREVPASELPEVPNLFAPRPWAAPAPVQPSTPGYDAPTWQQQQQPPAQAPQYAAPQYAEPQYAPPQPQHDPYQAQPQQHVQQPQQFQYAPVQPTYAPPFQQQHAQPQYADQPPVHSAPPQQYVQPQHAPTIQMPAQPAEPMPASGRRRSQAPNGMGSSVRVEGELERTFDRARAERAELAEEYRQLHAPLVGMPDEQVTRTGHAVPQHGHQPPQPGQGAPLFVHGQAPVHAPVQYPAPAMLPQLQAQPGGIPRPMVAGTMSDPVNADGSRPFQRRTPYSPGAAPVAALPQPGTHAAGA